jgi:large subunit ribosomal protein L3
MDNNLLIRKATIGLLGRKVGMTQIFDESGRVVPVTVLEVGPCRVLRLRTTDRDGYAAVQVGYRDKPRRLASRAERGQVANLDSRRAKLQDAVARAPKPDCEPQRFIREFRGEAGDLAVGQQLAVDVFADVKAVDVTGTSKGRGYAGVMKRHGYKGQRASHGVKKVHRHAGSTGCNTFPARVFKGRRMAGHMGAEQCTSRNLRVVRVDAENNLLLVRGAVPGPNGGYVVIQQTNKL